MHVVLTILKIIGIILLVILAILLLLLLAVLFVPLRYRVHGRKETKKEPEADGTMTWLLHLLRADLTYRDREGVAVIRVCGFRLKTFRFGEKKPERGNAPQKEESFGETAEEAAPATEAAEEAAPVTEAAEEAAPVTEAAEESVSATEAAEEAVPVTETQEHAMPQIEAVKDDGAVKETAAQAKKSEPEPAEEEESGIKRLFRRIFKKKKEEKPSVKGADSGKQKKEKQLHGGPVARLMNLAAQFLNKILDLLLQVPGLPAEVYDRIDIIQEKICKKYDLIRKKAEPFLSIEAEHMFWKGIGYLKYLIRGYAPRKITGYLHFGTGSPDLTGWLTGLVYMLLPESGTEYDVDPDFYEAVLETDTEVKGHIRAYRVAWVGLRLLFDKEFRVLFARIRGKERVQAHRGSRRARRKAMEESAKKAA